MIATRKSHDWIPTKRFAIESARIGTEHLSLKRFLDLAIKLTIANGMLTNSPAMIPGASNSAISPSSYTKQNRLNKIAHNTISTCGIRSQSHFLLNTICNPLLLYHMIVLIRSQQETLPFPDQWRSERDLSASALRGAVVLRNGQLVWSIFNQKCPKSDSGVREICLHLRSAQIKDRPVYVIVEIA